MNPVHITSVEKISQNFPHIKTCCLDWETIKEKIAKCAPETLQPFTVDNLSKFDNPEKWELMLGKGYLDKDAKVRYIRKGSVDAAYPPYTTVIVGNEAYVANKGTNATRIGEGDFKRYAYALSINRQEPYVLGSMKLIARRTPPHLLEYEIRDIARAELRVNRTLLNKSGFPKLLCAFVAPSKNGDYEKLYFLYERCMGLDLHETYAQEKNPYKTKITENLSDLLNVFGDVLSAVAQLEEAHILHRDIKPDNIFLYNKSDGSLGAKLGDFGSALTIDELREKLTDQCYPICGAKPLVCPQLRTIIEEELNLTPKEIEKICVSQIDIWSTGQILHLLLSGFHLQMNKDMALIDLSNQQEIGKWIDYWLGKGRFQPKCLKESPKTYNFLLGMCKRMLQNKIANRPKASELLKEFLDFRASIASKKE